MATPDEVRKLASLARISVTDEELPKLVAEFDGILAYVGKLEELTLPIGKDQVLPALRNVFRKDGEPHTTGMYTEKIVEQFPEKKGNHLSVKQIISHD
ncbi:MAG: glutamyl-tRNA(Gln) and/or aspartyl-tRNA(Asn) amidotransferase subunit [Parcubacteria group bacterium]|nr:glutamyl-tRNA(Gln) and/or aspartyl-tRNA(Asn) amidotransferase subunit [Parcubacteria group bacterium]